MRMLVILLATAFVSMPQPRADDAAAIRQTALDYIEGWFLGDSARLEKALHPDLAKRLVYTDRSGRSYLRQMSAQSLIQGAQARTGKHKPEELTREVIILDTSRNPASEMAMVKVVSHLFIDYLQMARWNGEWKIVNVLWAQNVRE